jgi:tetratricopeptide (TPR) repeat protein
MEMALELRQPDVAEKAIEIVDQGIQTVGFDLLKSVVVRGRARLAEMRGHCEEAIKYRQEQLALEPNSLGVHSEMARCYRTLGQIPSALEHAQMTLKARPFDARANYEIALDYLANNDRAKALEHLRRAVEVWRDADPTYSLANEAKKKLREVEAGS